jgi:DNA polymerase III alpha subunit
MSEYKINIPRLKLPKKFAKSPAKYLRKIVIDNAEGRGLFTPENREEYLQRIDHEIAVFERCGYVEYLLGVVKMTKEMSMLGISYIAGRGVFSASLVFYFLGITNINPIKHNLMFARFMPEDSPKFVEVELLIDILLRPSHLRDLERAIAYDESEGHSVTLVTSNITRLISRTNHEIWDKCGLILTDLYNGCNLRIPLDDAETYRSFQYGDLAGIYCLNRRRLVNELYFNPPTSFDDLVRLCAIHWHGAFEMFSENDSRYCFQEEIIRDAMACGFSETEADDLRRAVGKKQTEKLELYRPRWVAKYSEASWQTMTEQGLYSYPKAHAVVLAYLAYTTAYLKTHFPDEYTRVALCVAANDNL